MVLSSMSNKKRKRKENEKFIQFKEDATREFDDILLDSIDKIDDYSSFKKYSKSMESFTFKDVFKKG